jgi:hypothetical protein
LILRPFLRGERQLFRRMRLGIASLRTLPIARVEPLPLDALDEERAVEELAFHFSPALFAEPLIVIDSFAERRAHPRRGFERSEIQARAHAVRAHNSMSYVLWWGSSSHPARRGHLI